MIVVLASERDDAARTLAQRLPARLCTPRDLSAPGWQHHLGGAPGAHEDWAVVSGERVRAADIEGVIARLPAVRAEDLPHIVEEDREYVAVEMNALLLSWLTRLPCPVLNRPTPTSLMGPNLGHERWLVLAARAGLSLAPLATDRARPPAAAVVTVVGERWLGDVAPALGAQSLALARLVRVELCTVRFDGAGDDAAFVSADLPVDVADAAVADALAARLAPRGAA